MAIDYSFERYFNYSETENHIKKMIKIGTLEIDFQKNRCNQ